MRAFLNPIYAILTILTFWIVLLICFKAENKPVFYLFCYLIQECLDLISTGANLDFLEWIKNTSLWRLFKTLKLRQSSKLNKLIVVNSTDRQYLKKDIYAVWFIDTYVFYK